MVPVDTVAKGVVFLALRTPASGGECNQVLSKLKFVVIHGITEVGHKNEYHLVNSNKTSVLSFRELVENIQMFKPLRETGVCVCVCVCACAYMY